MANELDPVEIDINMKQNVSEESDRASKSMEDLAKSSQAALEALEKDVARQSLVIEDMRKVIESLQKQMVETPEIFGEKTVDNIENTKRALEEARQQIEVYSGGIDKMKKAVAEGVDVTDLANEATAALSDTQKTLVNNAEQLIETQESVNVLTDKQSKSTETNSASNKVMSATIDQIVKNLGLENTAIRQGITNTSVITAVKLGWAKAVAFLNVQLGLSVVASKALLITGIGALIVGIGLVVAGIKSWIENTKDLTVSLEEFNKSAASGAAKQRAEFEKLRQQWIASEGNLKEQERLVRENITAYNSFGVEINNVTDAENLFVNNADAFVASINKRAMAVAAMEIASKKYQESIQKMLDAENLKNNPVNAASFWQKAGSIFLSALPGNSRQSALADIINENVDDLVTESKRDQRSAVNAILVAAGMDEESTKIIEQAGFTATEKVKENSKKYYQQVKDYNQRLIDNMTAGELNSNEGKNTIKARDEAAKKLQQWDAKNTQRQQSEATRRAAKEKKANDDLLKKSNDYQKRIDAARIATLQDGAEKERKAIQSEYDQTKAYIEQQRREIADLEKITGQPATKQRDELNTLEKDATTLYESNTKKLNDTSKKAIDEIFSDVYRNFRSELDNNLSDIESYYDAQVKKAQEAGANIDQINEINSLREKERSRAVTESRLSQINFEAQIAERRINISGKSYLFQADKEKELLDIRIDAAKKTQEAIKEAYNANPTDELANSLKQADLQVEELNSEIKKLPASKFKEILGFANQLVGAIGNISGFDTSMLSGSLGALDTFLNPQSITLDKAAAGLGVVSSLVSGILNKGEREAQIKREILKLQQEYNISLRQQNYDLIQSIDYVRIFRDNIESLNWLVENGFISNVDYSAWEALNKQFDVAMQNIGAAQKEASGMQSSVDSFLNEIYSLRDKPVYDKFRDVIIDWKNGIISSEEALRRMEAKGWKGLADMAASLEKAKDEAEDYLQKLVEIQQQMDEFATGTSFDSFLSEAAHALQGLKGDVASLADFTEEALTNAVLSSFKYQILSNVLKGYYDELADQFTMKGVDNIDTQWAQSWRDRLEKELGIQGEALNKLFESMGLDMSSGSGREAVAKGIASISQDSANELNGNFYALRQSVNEMRNLFKEANLMRAAMSSQLGRISENTEYCRYLEKIFDKLNDKIKVDVKV